MRNALLSSKLENLQPITDDEDEAYIAKWLLDNPDAPRSAISSPCPPSLSRDTSAKILDIIIASTIEERVPVQLGLEFVKRGVLCEWVYVIDLDARRYEVHRGNYKVGKEDRNPSGRLAEVEGVDVSIVTSWDFDELPTQRNFTSLCEIFTEDLRTDGEDTVLGDDDDAEGSWEDSSEGEAVD